MLAIIDTLYTTSYEISFTASRLRVIQCQSTMLLKQFQSQSSCNLTETMRRIKSRSWPEGYYLFNDFIYDQ